MIPNAREYHLPDDCNHANRYKCGEEDLIQKSSGRHEEDAMMRRL
jgi:hypothetical protein